MTIGTELDAALAAVQVGPPGPQGPIGPQGVPGVTPDLTPIQTQIDALAARVTKLEGAPAPVQDVIVWQTVPTITFTQGVAGNFSVAGFVTSSLGLALTLTLNAVALPPGVTFDAPGKRFVYDGVGAAAITTGHVLTASDQ